MFDGISVKCPKPSQYTLLMSPNWLVPIPTVLWVLHFFLSFQVNKHIHLIMLISVLSIIFVFENRFLSKVQSNAIFLLLCVISPFTAILPYFAIYFSMRQNILVCKIYNTWSSAVAERPCDHATNMLLSHSRSLEIAPFNRSHRSSYWHSIVTVALSFSEMKRGIVENHDFLYLCLRHPC